MGKNSTKKPAAGAAEADAAAVTEAMGRVLYDYVFGMTKENLKLHREVSALIDASEHFPTEELRSAAKAAFKQSLESGNEVENALADAFSRSSSEERDRLFKQMADVTLAAELAAHEADAPGFVQEGQLSDADQPRFAGDGPDEALAAANEELLKGMDGAAEALKEDVDRVRDALKGDRVEAAASAAADAASDSVREAAANAAEDAADKVEGAAEDAAKKPGVFRRFAKSFGGAAAAAAAPFVRAGKWTGRKVAAGYARTLAPAFAWVGRKTAALGEWMSTKPVLRQIAAGTAWVGRKVGQGFGAVGRFLRYVGRGIRRWAPVVARAVAYTVLVVLAVIGAAVAALAVGIATGVVKMGGAVDGESVVVAAAV
jgi:hypothetical protein